MVYLWLTSILLSLVTIQAQEVIPTSKVPKVDVAYFGDSQLWYTFRGIEDFHKNILTYCKDTPNFPTLTEPLSYAGVGVSHMGFDDWAAKNGAPLRGPSSICNQRDGRVFGALNPTPDTKVYQYWQRLCRPHKSSLDAIYDLKPKIVVGFILGAHTGVEYETEIPKALQKFLDTIPSDMGCVIITSPPALDLNSLPPEIKEKDENFTKASKYFSVEQRQQLNESGRNLRTRAANFLHQEIRKSGRCELVPGHDQSSIGNDYRNYNVTEVYNNSSQMIIDTYHLGETGGVHFIRSLKTNLCTAIARALKRVEASTVKPETISEASGDSSP